MASLQAPMTRLSVETALLANGTNLLTFLGYIIAKVKEARSFKVECSRLANLCILLSLSFLENRSTLSKIRSGKEFIDCLQRVYTLVTQCTEKWAIRHIGWEIVVEGRVESLTKELEACQQSFNTEVLVGVPWAVRDFGSTPLSKLIGIPVQISINSASEIAAGTLAKLQEDLHSVKYTLQDDANDRKAFMNHVRDLEAEVQASRQEVRSLRPLKAPSLQIVPFPNPAIIIEEYMAGEPFSGTFDNKAVTFKKIMNTPQRLPRLVQVYEKIGNIARVQQLYAVTLIEGHQYALMQKLEVDRTLSSAIKSGGLSRSSLSHRLSFAYELAATVSALHSSGLLAKIISDMTVSVQSGPQDQILPLLSGLENARELWEVSTREEYDIRYQAPETHQVGMRSKMSDVWSLGVVLLQIFDLSFPFGFTAEEVQQDANKTTVMERLKAGGNPFKPGFETNQSLPVSIPIVNQCCARDPFVRPTASALAQGLFDLLIALNSESNVIEPVLEAGLQSSRISSLTDLSLAVQLAKSARSKLKKTKSPPDAGFVKIKSSTIESLLKANQDTDPTINMLVGQAYLLDLVDFEQKGACSYTTKSLEGQCAERGLPFVRAAEERGVEEARAELYQVHKILTNEHKALAVQYAGLK